MTDNDQKSWMWRFWFDFLVISFFVGDANLRSEIAFCVVDKNKNKKNVYEI
jgi:hypothetical protein